MYIYIYILIYISVYILTLVACFFKFFKYFKGYCLPRATLFTGTPPFLKARGFFARVFRKGGDPQPHFLLLSSYTLTSPPLLPVVGLLVKWHFDVMAAAAA